jgi:hypothetical protein
VLLVTPSGWTPEVNAQGDLFKLNSVYAINTTTSLNNISSIITPWNTGNDKNNSGS